MQEVLLKHQTQNQLAVHGEAAQARILVLEVVINQCGTNLNTPPPCATLDPHVHMVNIGSITLVIITKQGALTAQAIGQSIKRVLSKSLV